MESNSVCNDILRVIKSLLIIIPIAPLHYQVNPPKLRNKRDYSMESAHEGFYYLRIAMHQVSAAKRVQFLMHRNEEIIIIHKPVTIQKPIDLSNSQ